MKCFFNVNQEFALLPDRAQPLGRMMVRRQQSPAVKGRGIVLAGYSVVCKSC